MCHSHKAPLRGVLVAGLLLARSPGWAQTPAPDFETFVVPAPAAPPRSAPGAGPSAPHVRSSAGADPSQETVHADVDLTLFPGQRDLSLGLAGRVNGQDWASQVSPLRWLQGDWQNSGYLETSHNGGGARLGTANSDLLGSVQGFRLFSTPPRPGQASVGLGLYQRLGQPGAGGTLALDSRWQVGRASQVGMLLAADSSWRLTQQSGGRRWNLASFLGRDARTGRLEEGLFWEGRPSRSVSLDCRVSAWSGSQPGRNAALGLTRWVGPAFVAVDYSQLAQGEDRLRTTAATLFLPLRRDTLSLRWQRESDDSSGTQGRQSQGARTLLATFTAPVNPQTTLWVNGGLSRQSGADGVTATGGSFLTLGVQRTINARWDVQAEATRRLDKALLQGRLTLGYRLTPTQQVKLLFGPTTTYDSSGQARHAFGLEFVRRFDVRSTPTGTLAGQVLLDGAPCPKPLVVQVDQDRTAKTDPQGRFQLNGVAVGEHQVALLLAALPLDLSPVSPGCTVQVKARETSRVEFAVRRVGMVQGIVRVDPDAFGQTDCTAGIGVTITAGGEAATTTDAGNAFILGNVPVGRRQLTLVPSTIPPDFQIVGPDHFDLDIDPDRPAPPLEFRIAPRPLQISFIDAAAASQVASSEAAKPVTPPTPPEASLRHLRSAQLDAAFVPVLVQF